jgi:hypothetical protein
MRSAQTPRSRLATWCLTTDPPTPLLTIRPTRAGSVPSRGSRWSTRVGLGARRPVRTAAVKSVRRCIRCAEGSTGSGCETSAALATPRGENRATCASAHAKPEAVSLGSTPVVGLERTLHADLLDDLVWILTHDDQVLCDRSERIGRCRCTHTSEARGARPDPPRLGAPSPTWQPPRSKALGAAFRTARWAWYRTAPHRVRVVHTLWTIVWTSRRDRPRRCR